MKKTITIKSELQRREAMTLLDRIPANGTHSVTFKETSIRNLEQNAALWAHLSEISRQVVWYGNKLTAEEWKIVFTAALKKSKIVPDLDGSGFVSIGASTSKMTVREFSELLELIMAFGSEHNVKFSISNNP